MKTIKQFLILAVSFTLLSACKSNMFDDESVTPANELYAAGLEYMENKKYEKASLEFEKIFFQHPGKEITPKAELMQAYNLYLAGEHDESVDVLEIFIKLHPRHEEVAYAYYLRALNYYTEISDIELDQSKTAHAKETLQDVIEKFPNSSYAKDAASKIILVDDHLAAKNMEIGRYYLNKQNPIAAIKRFQNVIKDYSNTAHVPEALYRIVEGNVILGLQDEAIRYNAILAKGYQGTKWHNFSKNLLK